MEQAEQKSGPGGTEQEVSTSAGVEAPDGETGSSSSGASGTLGVVKKRSRFQSVTLDTLDVKVKDRMAFWKRKEEMGLDSVETEETEEGAVEQEQQTLQSRETETETETKTKTEKGQIEVEEGDQVDGKERGGEQDTLINKDDISKDSNTNEESVSKEVGYENTHTCTTYVQKHPLLIIHYT